MSLRPLSYDARLPLEEAGERLGEVQKVSDKLRKKYIKGPGKPRKQMSERDNKILDEAVGAVLHVFFQPSVQEDFGKASTVTEEKETVFYKSNELYTELSGMMNGRENTGTERAGYTEPFRRD